MSPKYPGKRILLVEDNIINTEIARSVLAVTSAELTCAANGMEAVSIYSSHPEGYFDLILTDYRMPVMDGCEATYAIRSLGRADSETVPIYAVSSDSFEEDIVHFRSVGMNGFLAKPYTPDALYRLLYSVFSLQ